MRLLRGLKWLGVVLVVVVALLCLGLLLENHRGESAWRACRAALEAQGERMDVESERPVSVPDDENFAMTPLLRPLRDYRFDPRTRQVTWGNTNATQGVQHLFGWRSMFAGRSAGWRGGEFADLAGYQSELRAQTNSTDPQVRALLTRPRGRPEDDLLFLFSRNAAELDELREAARRPKSSFDLHVDEGVFALLPELAVLKSFVGAFSTKALAELSAGHTEAAFADVEAAFGISDALRSEHVVISGLVRLATLEIAVQPLWEGLARHQWTAAQLEQFQTRFERINLPEEMLRDLRGDRVLAIATLDRMKRDPDAMGAWVEDSGIDTMRLFPAGWLCQNQVAIARTYQDLFSAFDADRRTLDLALTDRLSAAIEPRLRRRHPYTFFASMLAPSLDKLVAKTARTQATLALATTACALERSRIDAGRYPGNLDALVPRFSGHLPLDPLTGDPLKYRLRDDGGFVLYAVGLNLQDDGGVVPRDKKGRVQLDQRQGDWVWQYPNP